MKTYKNKQLDHIAYPLGGLGAGMFCLNGNGSLGAFSLRHKPQLKHNPTVFSAIHIDGLKNGTRVLEAPVPKHAYFDGENAGNGLAGTHYGLPRFESGKFSARFPFATLDLNDPTLPIKVRLVGWSPFCPNEEDRSSLPYASLEYTFTNVSHEPIHLVYSFNAFNPVKLNEASGVDKLENGLHFYQNPSSEKPHQEAHFSVSSLEPSLVDAAWFRGAWFDPLTMLWKTLSEGKVADQAHTDGPASPGGSLLIPFTLKPKEKKTITILLSWYVPYSEVRTGEPVSPYDQHQYYQPWYASRFSSSDSAHRNWIDSVSALRKDSMAFSKAFHASTIDPILLEAVSANLAILKSPTILRQKDGRLWAWEGCCDHWGCCDGSCTHVWNYAQTIWSLFPRLERGLRETEFQVHQDPVSGHQNFRVLLPIRSPQHLGHSAADGQLGGIIKLYREWRFCGDTGWMSGLFPAARQSLDFAIAQWDPDQSGLIVEPHHNTYDIEFWGAEPMNSGYYLGALKAMVLMSQALGLPAQNYQTLFDKGRAAFETTLYNGEYFHQKTRWLDLRTRFDLSQENPETQNLLRKEGPKYQYGSGCLSDALVGIWLSEVAGLTDLIDPVKLKSTLNAIVTYNHKASLQDHSNPQRPGYACADESGLLLCTWPQGSKPSLPFVYSDEIWTGIEYQVASHLIMKGQMDLGKTLVSSVRKRYDGTIRNPYSEYECGQWYARAMSSYALIQAASGLHYDGLTQTLSIPQSSTPQTFFVCTPEGFGTVTTQGDTVHLQPSRGTFAHLKIRRV